MPVVSPEKLIALQLQAEGIRNICVLAHVVRLPGNSLLGFSCLTSYSRRMRLPDVSHFVETCDDEL